MDGIDEAEQVLSEAPARLHAGLAQLLDAAGRRIYADSEHERRARELHDRYDAELTAAARAAERIGAEAQSVLDQPPPDELEMLTAGEIGPAAQLAPLIREDVQELPLSVLVNRFRTASQNNRIQAALLARYVGRLLDGHHTENAALTYISQRYGVDSDEALSFRSNQAGDRRFEAADAGEHVAALSELVAQILDRARGPAEIAKRQAAPALTERAASITNRIALLKYQQRAYGPSPAGRA